MAAHYMPKTLAKTLQYIAFHAPGEYGLFWDPDGAMPWKELYWALQEDASLRFVREAHLRELAYLGLDLPFALEGSKLHLKGDSPQPSYPVVDPPERLYHAFPLKRYPAVSRKGLSPSGNRAYLPLFTDREMALRVGKRRDNAPLVAEVHAKKAALEGALFRMADSGLYLAESISAAYLALPTVREDELAEVADRKKDKQPAAATAPATPGSFFVDPSHFYDASGKGPHHGQSKGGKKGKKGGSDWKRDSREVRRKREV